MVSIIRPVFSTKTFGVCIHSPLFGHVKPRTIIENIEINKVLGAEWFTFYIYSANKIIPKAFFISALLNLLTIVRCPTILKWPHGLL